MSYLRCGGSKIPGIQLLLFEYCSLWKELGRLLLRKSLNILRTAGLISYRSLILILLRQQKKVGRALSSSVNLKKADLPWSGQIEQVRNWYKPHFERIFDSNPSREKDLEQLVQMAEKFPSREKFLSELALNPPDITSDESENPLLDEDYLIYPPFIPRRSGVEGCLHLNVAMVGSPLIWQPKTRSRLRRKDVCFTWP